MRRLVFVIACGLLLCGCKSEESRMAGIWNGYNQPIELHPDKTYSLGKNSGTWFVKDNRMHMQMLSSGGLNKKQAFAYYDYIQQHEPKREAEMNNYRSQWDEWQMKISDDGNTMFKSEDGGATMVLNRAQG